MPGQPVHWPGVGRHRVPAQQPDLRVRPLPTAMPMNAPSIEPDGSGVGARPGVASGSGSTARMLIPAPVRTGPVGAELDPLPCPPHGPAGTGRVHDVDPAAA